jgi:hypothetical protein
MKFLILNTDYHAFLHWLYTQYPGLEKQSYREQMRVRNDTLHFRADFYADNLRKLGFDAYEIYANSKYAQTAWAKENGLAVNELTPPLRYETKLLRGRRWFASTPFHDLVHRVRPLKRMLLGPSSWLRDVLAAQIKHYKPDILLNTSTDWIGSSFLKTLKPYVSLLVAQPAPWPFSLKRLKSLDTSCYDLVVSAFPPLVQWFREHGTPAELLRLGFEPRVLFQLKEHEKKTIPISFLGSLYYSHRNRIPFLETLCEQFDIQVWGPGDEPLSPQSSIRKAYKGQAWGLEMYQTLAKSKITLNPYADVPTYATNMRLFEATGVGTLLMTEWAKNLPELFEPDNEVVAYRSAEECAELIQYYLDHEDERQAIARAGQERTLKEHTYFNRMAEFVDFVRKYL